MKITYSPLVASASGTTANAVASTWKGINYIRMHVFPHNPQTASQMAVRDSLSRCVTLWRSLNSIVKWWLNRYGVDYRMSGFNIFMKYCRALEQADSALVVVPPNPYVPSVLAFAAATGAGASGDIDITWTKEQAGALNHVGFFTRKKDTNVFTPWASVLDTDEALVYGGLTPDTDYDVYAMYYDINTGHIGTPAGILDVTSKA